MLFSQKQSHRPTPFVRTTALFAAAVLGLAAGPLAAAGEYRSGVEWPKPPVVEPGEAPGAPPSDSVILFDGTDASAWRGGENWIVENGELVVGKGLISTKQHFGDCQLHLEWAAPTPPTGRGQQRGNSGVFFHRFDYNKGYEVQVLDSFNSGTYHDGQAAAVYKQHPPMANAMRPPGEWNTYDIFWTTPKFDLDGKLLSPAFVTVVHNGVLVQNHFELKGDTYFYTVPTYRFDGEYGPICLQDHGDPVRYRNIWVRGLKPPVGEQVREPYFYDHKTKKETPAKAAGSETR